MAGAPAATARPRERSRLARLAGWTAAAVAAAIILFGVASALSGNWSATPAGVPPAGVPPPSAIGGAPGSSPSGAPVDPTAFLLADPRPAPAIELTSPDDRAFTLASLRGQPTFVFFGYTHCPDVCPATIGTVGLAIDATGGTSRAVFVSVDPERDTTAWLREYVRFMPAGFVAVTGTPGAIRATATAWGVQYAKVDTGSADGYSMSHTADVFLVDAAGMIRARFPFGTESEVMTAAVRLVDARPIAQGQPSPSAVPAALASPSTPSAAATGKPPAATPATGGGGNGPLDVAVVSSSVWSGQPGPIILALTSGGRPIDDVTLRPTVRLLTPDGAPIGAAAVAVPVRPPGMATVSYVVTLPVPTPGTWQLEASAATTGGTLVGSTQVLVRDPGGTAPLGHAAPTVRTPTLDDVGGDARAVTTDPAPDLRLSTTSTADALAAGKPFVLVLDSTRFRVSPVCGRAIIMIRYLLDRWRDVAFIHHEPFSYQLVSDTPVLDGSLDAPTLTDPAAAWGIGDPPWGARSMPWVFVVDGHGVVRAKYQGVMGSADVDVILALIEAGG